MRIEIQANGFVMTEALKSYTEQRLRQALGWADERLSKLVVSLSDINGPRGGIDKRCKIQVHLGGGHDVVVEDTEANLYVAIERAASRADRAVVRRIERMRGFSHAGLRANAAMAADVSRRNDVSSPAPDK